MNSAPVSRNEKMPGKRLGVYEMTPWFVRTRWVPRSKESFMGDLLGLRYGKPLSLEGVGVFGVRRVLALSQHQAFKGPLPKLGGVGYPIRSERRKLETEGGL